MFYPYNYASVAVAVTMMVIDKSVVNAATWTETFIPYNNDDNNIDDDLFGPHGPYTLDDPLRQHLHILKAPSNVPTPVYFYAHANNGKASGLDPEDMDIFIEAGYSIISWESVTTLDSPESVETCWSDFELVWSWFKENAATHNLLSSSVIIGGRSRGSVCSWPMAHSEKPEIQGIYVYNALPDSVWQNDNDSWVEDVTTGSPPAYLVYGPECPKPITQECLPSPDPTDGHNPRNGQKIVDRYTDLGIDSKIELIDGLENDGIGIYDLFPSFAASLASTCTAKMSELCQPVVSLQDCGMCAQANKAEIVAAGCTRKIVKNFCTSQL